MFDEQPLVSICIPVFNGEDFIAEAIESAINQTYQNLEILISDNDSTDKTPAILREYQEHDSRIVLINNKSNVGMVGNWNLLLLETKGKYIKFLCADDCLHTECIEKFVDVAEQFCEVAVVTSKIEFIGDKQGKFDRINGFEHGKIAGPLARQKLIQYGNLVGSPSAVMFRRDRLYIGLFNPAWKYIIPDYEMWIRLLGTGDLYIVDVVLSQYRYHSSQLSAVSNKNDLFFKEMLKMHDFATRNPAIFGWCSRKAKQYRLKRLIKKYLKVQTLNRGFSGLFKTATFCLKYSIYYTIVFVFMNLFRLIVYPLRNGKNRDTKRTLKE